MIIEYIVPEDNALTSKPLESVYMVIYNHEKWIGQAIEGVLMQKTSFKVELETAKTVQQIKQLRF